MWLTVSLLSGESDQADETEQSIKGLKHHLRLSFSLMILDIDLLQTTLKCWMQKRAIIENRVYRLLLQAVNWTLTLSFISKAFLRTVS